MRKKLEGTVPLRGTSGTSWIDDGHGLKRRWTFCTVLFVIAYS